MDLKVGCLRVTEAEMQPAIVHRVEAGLRGYTLRMDFSAVSGEDPRSNRATVALGSDQTDFQPIMIALQIVAK